MPVKVKPSFCLVWVELDLSCFHYEPSIHLDVLASMLVLLCRIQLRRSVLCSTWFTSPVSTARCMMVFIPLGPNGMENWNSVVSIVTRLQVGRLCIQFLAGVGDSSLLQKSILSLLGPTQPPSYLVSTRSAFLTFRGPCFVIYSYSKNQQDALFLNFILIKNSTCFRRSYCPSSGVLILYSVLRLMMMDSKSVQNT